MAKPKIHPSEMVGKRFGKWTVLKPSEARKAHSCWICQCDCGNQASVLQTSLRRGLSKSCGCAQKGGLQEITPGTRFGRLIVVQEAERHISPKGKISRQWKCLCDCGEYTFVQFSNLKNGGTQSCGCYKKEIQESGGTYWKHGQTKSQLYRVWHGMKQRCLNPNYPAYKDYGGRGITVCDRWINSFENFLSDMGECPPGLSLDRIDNNGNYEPGNCKWRSRIEQENNKRSNVYIEWQGRRITLAEAARLSGINYSVIRMRLSQLGWSPQKALTTPVRQKKK
jgi:hypothetical protein